MGYRRRNEIGQETPQWPASKIGLHENFTAVPVRIHNTSIPDGARVFANHGRFQPFRTDGMASLGYTPFELLLLKTDSQSKLNPKPCKENMSMDT